MFFSSLELIGFKSFKREKFTFDMPISLFVGPNGCGKTNIGDAIRWVLGEQNPYNLRAKSMSELIFHGGEKEKPMSIAEVSILLNNDHILPLEFEKVKLTRRVFPQGESEYMINQKSCRLKDITSLLLNTGLSSGYFLMDQEKIELILKSYEERLRLFEEASEIASYRIRKEEASSNLRKTLENITRIGDIMKELESQGESLKYQAAKARRYKRLKDELNVYKYHTLTKEYNEKKEELGLIRKEEEKIRLEIVKNEDVLRERRGDFEALLKRLGKKDEQLLNIRERREKIRDKIARQEERLIFLEKTIKSLKEKEKMLIVKEKGLKDEALAIEVEREGLLAQLEEEKGFEEADLLELKEKIQNLQKEEEKIKGELIDRLSRKAGIEGRIKEGEREIFSLFNRKKGLEEELQRLNKERDEMVLKREK
ncbi:MAG: AAA family ATPase, partial [bacterium]